MLLIDADSLIYMAGFATEGEPLANTLQVVKGKIYDCSAAYNRQFPTGTGEGIQYKVFLTGKKNFRKEIEPTYKANRTGRKPSAYEDIVTYLVDVHKATIVENLEADDVISIWARAYRRSSSQVMVASIDKDLYTFPGFKYNYKNNIITNLHPLQAERNFCIQILTGDTSDNIHGIGRLPAKAVLNTCREFDLYITPKELSNLSDKPVGAKRAEKLLSLAESNGVAPKVFTGVLLRNKAKQKGLLLDPEDQKRLELLWMVRELNPDGSVVPFDFNRYFRGI